MSVIKMAFCTNTTAPGTSDTTSEPQKRTAPDEFGDAPALRLLALRILEVEVETLGDRWSPIPDAVAPAYPYVYGLEKNSVSTSRASKFRGQGGRLLEALHCDLAACRKADFIRRIEEFLGNALGRSPIH
jgi:hypothetical protein